MALRKCDAMESIVLSFFGVCELKVKWCSGCDGVFKGTSHSCKGRPGITLSYLRALISAVQKHFTGQGILEYVDAVTSYWQCGGAEATVAAVEQALEGYTCSVDTLEALSRLLWDSKQEDEIQPDGQQDALKKLLRRTAVFEVHEMGESVPVLQQCKACMLRSLGRSASALPTELNLSSVCSMV